MDAVDRWTTKLSYDEVCAVLRSNPEADGLDECIVPCDHDKAGLVTDDQLFNAFDKDSSGGIDRDERRIVCSGDRHSRLQRAGSARAPTAAS